MAWDVDENLRLMTPTSSAPLLRNLPVARVTLVIPCLNEAATLGGLIQEAWQVFSADNSFEWRILVADNGSSDASARIARENGAEVIYVLRKGYGAALDAGIRAALTDWVIYFDADTTYRPTDALAIMKRAAGSDLDLVVGNRLRGEIQEGSMPWLHRYLGTPILSWLIRTMTGSTVGDCNSGIRAVRVHSYLQWQMRSPGMEFASELLLKAALNSARVAEVPSGLRRGPIGRVPHLRTWRDGMRHLLVILCASPRLFWNSGLALLVVSLAMQAPSLTFGELPVFGRFVVFGPHTQALAILLGVAGGCVLNVGLVLYGSAARNGSKPALARILSEVSEARLFWSLLSCSAIFSGAIGVVFWNWFRADFSNLNFLTITLGITHFAAVFVSLVVGILQCHIQKRSSVFET